MGEPAFIFLLLTSIAFNYYIGITIDSQQDCKARKRVLILGVVINLSVLGFFKYIGFFLSNISIIFGDISSNLDKIIPSLPLGISFYTFHAMSYLIDVYRRDVPAERSIRNLALYISMFPQLVAGPIIRYKFIATELHQPVFTSQRIADGIAIFLIGLGQKVLIANTLAVSVDAIFNLPLDRLSSLTAWSGIVFYTLQIYYDFGGYSLMAIGLALMIGFTFPPNFNYPYVALSVTDFWRRWHMSLSSWFRDYLYIPLGGKRGSPLSIYRNLFTVFLLCGLWHGASWNFVVWGLLHGSFLVAERSGWGNWLQRQPAIVRSCYTLLFVMVAWVFFRSDTLSYAFGYLAAMFGLGADAIHAPRLSLYFGADVVLALAVALLIVGPWGQTIGDRFTAALGGTSVKADLLRVCALCSILGLVVLSLAGGAYNPFIYFRF